MLYLRLRAVSNKLEEQPLNFRVDVDSESGPRLKNEGSGVHLYINLLLLSRVAGQIN